MRTNHIGWMAGMGLVALALAGCESNPATPPATDTSSKAETTTSKETTTGAETATGDTAKAETTAGDTAKTEATTADAPMGDAKPPAGGHCMNAPDLNIIATKDVPKIAETAGYACLGQPDAAAKEKCAREKVAKDSGLTEPCAACYSDQVVCVLNSAEAIGLCAANPDDFPCVKWRAAHCPDFYVCSGLENCRGGKDEDGDGKTDCADEECATDEVCLCADAKDNDDDKFVDCDDPDCCGVTGCDNAECK